MTTRADAYQLLQAVRQGSQSRLVKSRLPVLTGVLLKRANAHIEVLSTDLENFEAGSCHAFGDEETWEIVLPSAEFGRLADLPILRWLQAIDPPKTNKRGDNWLPAYIDVLPRVQTLKVTCGNITAHFKGINAQEFPLIPQEKINDKLFANSEAQYDKKKKKRKRLSPEEVLARAAEEAWQKALKQTKRMSAEDEVEHWKTWLPLLEEHQADIEKRLTYLAERIEKNRQAEVEWQAECRKREDQEHQERLERLAWLDLLREGLRAEFDATLRRDKRNEMNSLIEAWPFHNPDDSVEPTYPTSYHWLEAVFVWNGEICVGRGKRGSCWGRAKYRYFDSILGYEVNRYQVAYAKLLSAKWRFRLSASREEISPEEINHPYGE